MSPPPSPPPPKNFGTGDDGSATSPSPVLAAGDPVALRQVLHNLLVNASDAVSGRDHPRVSVFAEGGRREVRLVVEDNGGGVPSDLLPRVFDPHVSGKPDGAGIGLAVARTIAEEHDGALTLENIPGGARAVLTLPVFAEQDDKDAR